MNKIRNFIVVCVGFLLWMTCTMDSDSDESYPLSKAIHVVDNNPKEALALLENIPDPEHNKDQYMQYIVVLTQARYMDYQDITTDSIILDAQRYFANTQSYEMAARASYYAASYWHEGDADDKAVEYWQAAFSFAERAGNDLFMDKSAYSLGMSYYNQEQWEEATIYCQKALELYDNKSDAEHYKLDLIEMLGQIYREQQDPKQAYFYFNKGLEAAKNLNDIKYESRFLRQKGIIHRNKGEYPKAKEYFDLALSKQPETDDLLRIYLSYAKLYEDINRPDSVLHYLSIIENQIPKITYPNTRRDIYKILAKHYTFTEADAYKATRYLQLAYTEDSCIKENRSKKKAEALNQQLDQVKQEKQTERHTYQRNFKYGIIALFVLLSMVVWIEVNKNKLKKKYRQIREKYFFRTIDQRHFLLGGLRIIAKSTDCLNQKELYDGSPNLEQQLLNQQLVLREEFTIQIAEYVKQDLEKFYNGRKALSMLTQEDLSIIYMSGQRVLSYEYIGWMLGHKGNKEQYVIFRKGQIRQIMTEAGMRDRDVKRVLP